MFIGNIKQNGLNSEGIICKNVKIIYTIPSGLRKYWVFDAYKHKFPSEMSVIKQLSKDM